MDKKNIEVIVGTSYWTLNGVNVFAENLVRDLCTKGISAHILLTEEDSVLIKVTEARMQRPDDIPFVELPVERWRSWGAHWGAMIRYLEERAPCIYIPNSDWRHSCVCPLLSKGVGIVGVVHSDDPLHYDHVARLGRYWNMIVTTSTTIAKKTLALDSTLQDRLVTIPIGVDIPFKHTKRTRGADEPLKLIYHGTLKQHQKRILDFPKIISKVAQSGIPVTLTLAGGGPDEEELRKVSQKFVEQGLIRFPGIVPRDKIFDLLESHDVYILTSEFEGMPNALLEAMGRGCVPLVTNMESAVPDLVRDGHNGFVVPIGDIDAFVQRLRQLYQNPDQRLEMSLKAYETVSNGKFRIQDMVDDYIRVFDRVVEEVRGGIYKRPPGVLEHPPAQVAGVNLFPVELLHEEKGVGHFPIAFPDYRDFREQIQQIPSLDESPLAHLNMPGIRVYGVNLDRLKEMTVIVAAPVWTSTGVNDFSANLVQELRAKGIAAHILLTEEETDLVKISDARMPRPSDVPFEQLPIGRTEGWGAHWGAMIRYLEERAPCIYIPNHDWRHSCVSPLLSNQVIIVGVVHGDAPLHFEHVQRLGSYWNAIVTTSSSVAQKIHAIDAALTPRIAIIPSDSANMAQDYLDLLDKVVDEAYRGVFQRPKGLLQPPPAEVAETPIFPVELGYEEKGVGWFPTLVCDYRVFKKQIQQIKLPEASPLAHLVKPGIRADLDRLKEVTVIVASPVWTSSGVNDFSANLVRELRAKGISAHILLTEEETDLVNIPEERMLRPTDVPFEQLPIGPTENWGAHWGAMIHYLEAHAPCIYIPNHDWRHSCVSPLLSNRIVIVGIVYGDDPLHYDHVRRLGRYWNAIVAIDDTVARKIQTLDPSLTSRIAIIPPDPDEMTQDYLELFDQVVDEVQREGFRRPMGLLQPPPAEVAGINIFPVELFHEFEA